MKLKIEVTEEVCMKCDLEGTGAYVVQIELHGNRHYARLQKGEHDPTPVSAKKFLEYLNDHKGKSICIATEESLGGSFAWVCKCDGFSDSIECVMSVDAQGIIVKRKDEEK